MIWVIAYLHNEPNSCVLETSDKSNPKCCSPGRQQLGFESPEWLCYRWSNHTLLCKNLGARPFQNTSWIPQVQSGDKSPAMKWDVMEFWRCVRMYYISRMRLVPMVGSSDGFTNFYVFNESTNFLMKLYLLCYGGGIFNWKSKFTKKFII